MAQAMELSRQSVRVSNSGHAACIPVTAMLTVAVVSYDEPSIILCNRLRRAGIRTAGAYVQDLRSGAVDPSEFIASEQPDLIVYDLYPPVQQSLKFLAYLRALPGMDRVPFILTREESMALPPFTMSNLAGLLTRPYDFTAARLVVHSALHLGLDDAA
jgi:CheY-like chemotaxis protein